MHIETGAFYELREKQKKLYKSFVPVRCYMLREDVHFNRDGFEHLYKKGTGKYRNKPDAANRLTLLDHVPTVIAQSKFIKEVIKYSDATKSKKVQKYWALYYKVGSTQLPVVLVLRRVGNGHLHFYGIRLNKKRKRPPKRS
jgi:hypothetical protein